MDNTIYYSLPTVRKMRRQLRKACSDFKSSAIKASLVLRDDDGSNILKTRKYKGRILRKRLKS